MCVCGGGTGAVAGPRGKWCSDRGGGGTFPVVELVAAIITVQYDSFNSLSRARYKR